MEHRLKTLPEYFCDVADGRKQFEVRRDDREPPYAPGDTLLLEEYTGSKYTGKWIRVNVDLVLRGKYCKDGYCIMSITCTAGNGLTPPTRADRIRAMSDEELAKIIAADCLDERLHFCQNKTGCYDILDRGECVPEELCVRCVMDWLSQPVEED